MRPLYSFNLSIFEDELFMTENSTTIKRMAHLLKSGATMLDKVCPKCHVPLFKLKSGEVICPSCGQRFVIVQSEEEEIKVYIDEALKELERLLTAKIYKINSEIRQTEKLTDLSEIMKSIYEILKVIELSRSIRKRHDYESKTRES